jgi:hypothetical protein
MEWIQFVHICAGRTVPRPVCIIPKCGFKKFTRSRTVTRYGAACVVTWEGLRFDDMDNAICSSCHGQVQPTSEGIRSRHLISYSTFKTNLLVEVPQNSKDTARTCGLDEDYGMSKPGQVSILFMDFDWFRLMTAWRGESRHYRTEDKRLERH